VLVLYPDLINKFILSGVVGKGNIFFENVRPEGNDGLIELDYGDRISRPVLDENGKINYLNFLSVSYGSPSKGFDNHAFQAGHATPIISVYSEYGEADALTLNDQISGNNSFASYTTTIVGNVPSNFLYRSSRQISGSLAVVSDGDVEAKTIGEYAFCSCDNLPKNINLAQSIERIRDYAFLDCNYVGTTPETFTFPSNLKELGLGAFFRSNPETTGKNSYGRFDFSQCINSFEEIGDYAFYNNTQLSSVYFGDDNISTPILKSLGNSTFYNCIQLSSVENLPSSLEMIGNYDFFNCVKLESISIPDNVKTIGYNAFLNCLGLSSVNIGIESKLSSIENNVFQNCNLLSFYFPDYLEEIGSEAFYGNKMLSDVFIPKSVHAIGINAFFGCSNKLCVHFEASEDEVLYTYGIDVANIGNYSLLSSRINYSAIRQP
jgi:hypothetical protein